MRRCGSVVFPPNSGGLRGEHGEKEGVGVGQRPGHGLPEAAGSYRRGKALKLMQFSLTLANKFILEDLPGGMGVYRVGGRRQAPERGRKPIQEGDQDGPGKTAGSSEETNRIMIRYKSLTCNVEREQTILTEL